MEQLVIVALVALPLVISLLIARGLLRGPLDSVKPPEPTEPPPPEYRSGWYVDQLYSGRRPPE
ncbi:hypothetical protein JMUB6875_29180 [Nocardia sp. JMUB6875]